MISTFIKTQLFLLAFFLVNMHLTAQEIFKAINNKNLEQVEIIVRKNSNVVNHTDTDKNTPLHYAASIGQNNIIVLLLKNGADIDAQNYQGYTPLHWAASKGHTASTQILIENGANIHLKTKRGRTPLFLVAMNNGNTDIARLLLDAGADVNTRENSGSTPLAYAPFRGFSDLIDVLLDNGAEVETDSDLWYEVFHRACSIGHKRLAKLMIKEGINIDRKNEDGRLPLHSAVEGGSLQLVKFLVEKGNPVNCKDYCGATPLHLASASGHTDVVIKLLELGSDINARNSIGASPYNLALENDKKKVMEILIANGANSDAQQFPDIHGEYLGQQKPGIIPEVFGPGLISAYLPIHGCVSFSSDGTEVYWSVVDFHKRGSSIYHMKMINGKWSKPEIPTFAFSSEYSDDVPFISPDGTKLYFLSNRPVIEGGDPAKENIWFMERKKDKWVNASPVGPAINKMGLHWQFSVADNATIYFASDDGSGYGLNDIYCSKLENNEYQNPKNLGDSINSKHVDFAPYISPDESFLVFSSTNRAEGSGLYISFKKDGSWSKAEYLGNLFGDQAILTTMSPDGKYLFFTGRKDGRKGVFWVDAKIIKELKSNSCNG